MFIVVPEVSEILFNSFLFFFLILLLGSYFHHFVLQVTYSFFCLSFSVIDADVALTSGDGRFQTVHLKRKLKNVHYWGFPGGAVVENLPANVGDAGSSPGLGRSHMPRSNWAREPQLLSLCVWSLCSATRGRDGERPVHCDEEWPPHRDEEWPPLATTREGPRTETKTNKAIHTYIHTYIKKKRM